MNKLEKEMLKKVYRIGLNIKYSFSYLGIPRELDLHQNDIIIEFEDKNNGKYYNVMPKKVFEKSEKKYLHIQ